MTHEIVSIQENDDGDEIILDTAEKQITLAYDKWVGDWMVIYRTASGGVGQPGGIRDRAEAIEYALYRLGALEDCEAHPIDRVA